MVKVIRWIAVTASCIAMAVGVAGLAQGQGDVKAPGVPEGVYNVNIAGQAATTWEIYPICVPTVGDLREPLLLPVACRLKVTPHGRGGSEATMIGDRWTFTANTFDSMRTCPNGEHVPQQEIYSFDPYTLAGEMQILHGDECGDQPAMVNVPLTMSFNRPLEIPVTQYPLICEPGGLRRCF
jgi:hypothetical protein